MVDDEDINYDGNHGDIMMMMMIMTMSMMMTTSYNDYLLLMVVLIRTIRTKSITLQNAKTFYRENNPFNNQSMNCTSSYHLAYKHPVY